MILPASTFSNYSLYTTPNINRRSAKALGKSKYTTQTFTNDTISLSPAAVRIMKQAVRLKQVQLITE